MPEIKKAKEVDLKLVFSDVISGYTEINSKIISGQGYIKHLNIFDNVQTDKLYEDCLNKAINKGLSTEEDQKKYLEKEGIWTQEQENEISGLEIYVNNLKDTKSKLFLKSQIDPMVKDIEEAEQKIYDLGLERAEAIGYTAETYAHKRANEMYIQQAVFKDFQFKTPAISAEEFDHINDAELKELTIDYNKSTEFVTLENIKKISLMPFFCNYFYLCDDNPLTFFGKPVIELSFFQAELFAFGRYFKSLVQDSKASPPDDIKQDPDKLMDFYEMRKNADEVMDKMEQKSGEKAGASSLVGATKEDLEAIGIQDGVGKTITLNEVAAKKGGNLSMNDFVDLHG